MFTRIDVGAHRAPDATTLLGFRHLLEEHRLGQALMAAQNRFFEANGWIMRGGSGVDAGAGYVHSLTVTAANVSDIDETTGLVRPDDEVVWADAGYVGIEKRPEVVCDPHLSQARWRVAAREGKLKTMHPHEQGLESGKASSRAMVEHPYLIVKRQFGFVKTRYRGLAKNKLLSVLFSSANWLMRARAVAIMARAG